MNCLITSELADKRPKFLLNLSVVLWVYDKSYDTTIFFLGAEIINQGEPSIVTAWQATYRVGQSSEVMQMFHLINSYSVKSDRDFVTLTNADLIIAKTHETQIPRGGRCSGRLLLTLPGDRGAQVAGGNYTIEVTCMDYLFNPVTAFFAPSTMPISGGIVHLPTEKVELIPAQPALTSGTQLPPSKAAE